MMLKIGLVAVAAVFIALPLRKDKGEFTLLIGLVASILIFLYALDKLQMIADFLSGLMDRLPIENSYLAALFKMLGIIYIADFTSNICREAGFGSIGNQIEIFAKLSIVALSIPVLVYLVDVVEGFL